VRRPLLLLIASVLVAVAVTPFVAVSEEKRGSFVIPIPQDYKPSKPVEPPKPAAPPKPMTRIEQPMAPGVAEALAKEGKKTYTYRKSVKFSDAGVNRVQAVKGAASKRLQAERVLVRDPIVAWKTLSYTPMACQPPTNPDYLGVWVCAFDVVYEVVSTKPAPAGADGQSAGKADTDPAALAYLQAVMRGTTLTARKCPDGEGKYYVVGKRPKISPEVVPCVDVHFRAQCPGSNAYIDGVAPTFIGVATDCFMGDTAKIDPTPGCPVDQVRVSVVKVTSCGVR